MLFQLLLLSLIWRHSRFADTHPLLHISRYKYCLFVVDISLCSEVFQPGGSWSSPGPGSMYAPNHQVECDATFPYYVTMESQSPVSPSRRVGFVLTMLNTSSLVTCSVHEMRSILR